MLSNAFIEPAKDNWAPFPCFAHIRHTRATSGQLCELSERRA
jgi:hypothetical protein